MGLRTVVRDAWGRFAREARKTETLPLSGAVYSPVRSGGMRGAMPKPTADALRRMAEMPAARRAINYLKNKVATMEWRVEARPGLRIGDAEDLNRRAEAVTRALQLPNAVDSFQSLMEQVIEDVLVGGFGAIEMRATPDAAKPLELFPVDGASIQIDPGWNSDPHLPRYEQVRGFGNERTPLLDSELIYLRLNARTHTPFGLGKMEVAFEAITNFLQAHRYAGKLAANGVVQYALWMNDRTPEQQERLIRWWQDEVEGSGRVPVLHSETKPEVLRFAGGTDADLHLQWQQFLLTMIANAFDLPPMVLGVTADVNRSTAQEMADEAFQNAVVPLAKLVAEHITRDAIAKCLGWDDLRFCWSELESRDEVVELESQLKLLAAGVVTVAEVRKMRGLAVLDISDPGGQEASDPGGQ